MWLKHVQLCPRVQVASVGPSNLHLKSFVTITECWRRQSKGKADPRKSRSISIASLYQSLCACEEHLHFHSNESHSSLRFPIHSVVLPQTTSNKPATNLSTQHLYSSSCFHSPFNKPLLQTPPKQSSPSKPSTNLNTPPSNPRANNPPKLSLRHPKYHLHSRRSPSPWLHHPHTRNRSLHRCPFPKHQSQVLLHRFWSQTLIIFPIMG